MLCVTHQSDDDAPASTGTRIRDASASSDPALQQTRISLNFVSFHSLLRSHSTETKHFDCSTQRAQASQNGFGCQHQAMRELTRNEHDCGRAGAYQINNVSKRNSAKSKRTLGSCEASRLVVHLLHQCVHFRNKVVQCVAFQRVLREAVSTSTQTQQQDKNKTKQNKTKNKTKQNKKLACVQEEDPRQFVQLDVLPRTLLQLDLNDGH